jgi:hypothetical protein
MSKRIKVARISLYFFFHAFLYNSLYDTNSNINSNRIMSHYSSLIQAIQDVRPLRTVDDELEQSQYRAAQEARLEYLMDAYRKDVARERDTMGNRRSELAALILERRHRQQYPDASSYEITAHIDMMKKEARDAALRKARAAAQARRERERLRKQRLA